jgi:hypothetical protein
MLHCQSGFAPFCRQIKLIMMKSPGSAGGLQKFDVSAMEADEQSLDWLLMPERRRRAVFVERGMMESERRRCDIILAW